MQATSLILTLLEYKAWANNDLFSLLQSLPDEPHAHKKHDATRILNHVYIVDRIFEANVQRKEHEYYSYKNLNTPETPTLEALHKAVRVTDQWFLEYVASLTDSSLDEAIEFTFVDGSPGQMTRGEILMHVITHGNYHRGAVGRILAQLSITPPRDILTVFLHSPRQKSSMS
jgi:uncharacterized damage-inducible protein DinB